MKIREIERRIIDTCTPYVGSPINKQTLSDIGVDICDTLYDLPEINGVRVRYNEWQMALCKFINKISFGLLFINLKVRANITVLKKDSPKYITINLVIGDTK